MPVTSTVWPGRTFAILRNARNAAVAEVGTAGASTADRLAGTDKRLSAGTQADSASVPAVLWPNTSSPGRRAVTSFPTAVATPARSLPGMPWRGRRSLNAKRTTYGSPVMTK